MLTRIQIAAGFALAVLLITSMTAFAKGGFDFITITGPNLKQAVRVTDTSLTTDFFTFANFYEDKTKAPEDPGEGYEITRHYEQGVSDVIFDRLHYYPESGFVFYDGIENGESEYDGEWYTANPEIKLAFETALSVQTGLAVLPENKEAIAPVSQTQPAASSSPALPILVGVLTIGLAVFFFLGFWRRRSSVH